MDTPAPRRRFDPVAYLKLFRFPLVFTAIADSAAGYMIAMPNHQIVSHTLGLLALSSSGLYLFGMTLNDIADLEKDRVGAPSKVLPSGRISRGSAVAAAVVLVLISLLAVVLIPETSVIQRLLVWGGIFLSILAYDLHWLKASPIMGMVRALNVALGVIAAHQFGFDNVTGAHPWKLVLIGLPAFIYGSSLTYVSTLEDSEVDRRKLAIGIFGMAVGALFAAMVVPLLDIVKGGDGLDVNVLPALVVAWVLVGWIIRRAWKARDRKLLMLVVRDGVAGYILVDAALVLPVTDWWRGVIVGLLLIPAASCLVLFKKLA